MFEDQLKKWQGQLSSWGDREKEAGTELEKLQEPPTGWAKFTEWLAIVSPPHAAWRMLKPLISTPSKELPFTLRTPREVVLDKQQEVYRETVREVNRASFFTTLYQTIPIAISLGKVSSFDDVAEQFHGKLGNLSEEDIELAETIVNGMLSQPLKELPVGVSPEEAKKVEEWLTEPTPSVPRFQGVHLTTVQEMIKWLSKQAPKPILPEGMSDKDVIAIADRLGLTKEQLASEAYYDEIAGIVGDAWEEQQDLVDMVLSGKAEWEMPEMTPTQRIKFMALQPFQTIADALKPYLEYWNYPLANIAVTTFQKLKPGLQEQERLFEEARTTDNWWMAHSKAWEENDASWGAKLAIEIVIDPLTYIGVGLIPKALKGVGMIPKLGKLGKGISRLGRACGSFEEGFNAVSAIPFDWLKVKWARVPKNKIQVVRAEDEKFFSVLSTSIGARTGKIPKQWTHDDVIETCIYSVEHYHADKDFATKGAQDYFSELGSYLVDLPPMKPGDIMKWVKQLDGKLLFSEITPVTIDNVNNVLYDVLAKKGSLSENAGNLLRILMVEGDAAKLKTAMLLLKKEMGKVGERLEGLANIKLPGKMLGTLSVQQHKIIEMTARSEFANSRLMAGHIGGLMNHISQMESTVWRNVIDRMLVRPMAEAYLGFKGYPIWNAIEDMFRSVVEGVLPKQMTLDYYHLVTLKINTRDIRLATGGASDVRGMLGDMHGREGMVSFLPGKVPDSIIGKVPVLGKTIGGAQVTEWLGRHWVELSNTWGNGFRRNFTIKKYLQILAKRARDIDGRDVTETINTAIKGAGKIPHIRGIKPADLKNEAFARFQTGNLDTMKGLKETIGNSAFLEKEQMKILHLADELTPQARTLGEQGILAGDAMRDPSGYCKAIADQLTTDVKAEPLLMADNFESMADQLTTEIIASPEDLIQAFQTLEVAEDIASVLPYRMMSKTHEVSDALMAQGKFGKIIRQLWTSDRDEMLNALDRVSIANQRIKQKILDSIPAAKLTTNQDHALRELLEYATTRDELKAMAIRRDGDLLDAFWLKPKVERTSEAHQAIRAERAVIWNAYRKADAEYFGREFIMRRNYANLYNKIPKRPILSVNATDRGLTPNDIARVLGCNVDNTTSTILDVAALQDRDHFVQLIKHVVDDDPTNFKGFTEDGISKAYDTILDNVHINPDMDIQLQRSLMQIEGIKQELIALKQTGYMTAAEEAEAFKWVDNLVSGMDELMYEPAKAIPAKPKEITFTGITAEQEIATRGWINDIPVEIELDVKNITIGIDPSGAKAAASYNPSTKTIYFRDAAALKDSTNLYHELGHGWIHTGLSSMDTKVITRTTEALGEFADSFAGKFGITSDMAVGIRKVHDFEDSYRLYKNVHETFAHDFERWITHPKSFSDAFPETASVFRKYFPAKPAVGIPPIKPPARVLKPEYRNWDNIRQESWDKALKSYYSAFTDYTHENAIDFAMKHIYPYWVYESQRWFFLPKTFIRRPGILTAWGKYANYTENGYFPLPGTDLQVAGARGTVFGLTYSLTRKDYPFYYQQLGPVSEVVDWTMRMGFYPGIHFTLPLVLSPIFTGREANLGEAMPALYKTALDVLVASNIPKVSEDAQWLTDHVFHENFRDYNIATLVSKEQGKAGGKLIAGQSGVDLWVKRQKNFGKFMGELGIWGISDEEIDMMEGRIASGRLTPEEATEWNTRLNLAREEDALWNDAAKDRAALDILMTQFPIFRIRPEEQVEAYKRVSEIIEETTGLAIEQQDYLWKHNMRPSDVCPTIMGPTLRKTLNTMWEYKIWLGRGTILKPQKWSELDIRTSSFWNEVKGLQKTRTTQQEHAGMAFLTPTAEAHLDGREWRGKTSESWSNYTNSYDILRNLPDYADIPMTLDERAEILKKQGFTSPTASMFDEILRIYYNITPQLVKNKYTGEEETDWTGFYVNRQAVVNALPPDLKEEFIDYTRAYEAPLETKFREVTNTYFKGYWAVRQIVLNQYPEEEKAIIAEYYADVTTLTKKREIEAFVSPTSGRQLISGYTSELTNARAKLRMVSPKLDFYLYVFGYVSTPKTDEARTMIDTWEKDKTTLLI